ncbi:MAG: histidine phosphatase family protein [Clostridiales Family XIII bacterium]|jgi:broad specificity phosphatase PhoE/CTP:molybdopterin cytidylyltransferase MocA|nr:histidine phosphatase family protein [Clostridiales Family XIII bacterium]
METAHNNIYTAVILAAGYSSRMGAFKALLDVDGKPALYRLLDSIRAAGVRDVIVVTGHERAAVEDAISRYSSGAAKRGDGFAPPPFSLHTVYNEAYADGMFSSVRAGLAALVKNAAGNGALIFPVDTPLVSSKTVASLIAAADGAAKGKVQGDARGGPASRFPPLYCPAFLGKKGHPLLIPAELIPSIIAYDGPGQKGDGSFLARFPAGGLKGALAAAGAQVVPVETGDEGAVLDMDTPADYEDLLLLAKDDGPGLSRDLFDRAGRPIFVRHGEIRQHSGKIFLGQTDAPLSETGRAEAEAAARRLLELGVSRNARIVSSDLSRAAETARIIADRLTRVTRGDGSFVSNCIQNRTEEPSPCVAGLREMDLGAWDGRLIDDIKTEFPDAYERRGENLLTWKESGGENYYDMRYRVLRTLRRLFAAETGARDIIVVTHAGPIRAVISVYTGTPLEATLYKEIPRCIPLDPAGKPR